MGTKSKHQREPNDDHASQPIAAPKNTLPMGRNAANLHNAAIEHEGIRQTPSALSTVVMQMHGVLLHMPAYFFFGFTAAFKVAPAENFGDLDAAILIASPVAGLRPLRAARLETENVPNPVMATVSPFFRRSVIMAMSVFTASLVMAADNSVRFESSAISSPFFIKTPWKKRTD